MCNHVTFPDFKVEVTQKMIENWRNESPIKRAVLDSAQDVIKVIQCTATFMSVRLTVEGDYSRYSQSPSTEEWMDRVENSKARPVVLLFSGGMVTISHYPKILIQYGEWRPNYEIQGSTSWCHICFCRCFE